MSRLFAFRLVLREPLALVGFIWLLVVLIGCSGQSGRTLTGVVTDAYTGQPVDAASITVGRTNITTSTDGRFSTTAWGPSDALKIERAGYEALSVALAENAEVKQSAVLTVTLAPTLRPNTLSGTISDQYSGKPLAGAELRVTLDVSNTLAAKTDAAGRYTLAGVPEQFALAIAAPDYAPVELTVERLTAFDLALRPSVLGGTVRDVYTAAPVAGAVVRAGSASATTAADGSYKLVGVPADSQAVEISADGYASLTQTLEKSSTLDVKLRPDTLIGTLVNKQSGKPIANATVIATSTANGSQVAFTRIDGSRDGSFTLKGMPERGFLQVLAPGYSKRVIEIVPGKVPAQIELEPFTVKALYVTAAIASWRTGLQEYIDLIDKTELNAIIIDIKSDMRDDLGLVYYDSQVPLAKELKLAADHIDMAGLVKELKAKGIYTIARIQLFSHDNALADARPEWAIRLKESGEVYADYPGPNIRYAYLDPTNKNVWDYNIQLGIEAAQMGFDEINYDYVRFPDIKKGLFAEKLRFSEPIDAVKNPNRMFEVIGEFAEASHKALNGVGAFVSIDVFGRAMLGASLSIAQDMSLLGKHTDYVAPMPYPSLWWSGVFDIDVPVQHPYEVLKGATAEAAKQMEGSYGKLRPWLQDHTDPWAAVVVEYGPTEVRAQIKAVEENPAATGWMLYDSANAYKGAFNGAVKAEK